MKRAAVKPLTIFDFRAILAALILCLLSGLNAWAQGNHQEILESVVRVTAIDIDDPINNKSTKNGFVTEGGHVLTVYSMLSELNHTNDVKLEISVQTKVKEFEAAIAYVSPRLDLILLSLDDYDESTQEVVIESVKDLETGQVVYLSSWDEDEAVEAKIHKFLGVHRAELKSSPDDNDLSLQLPDEGSPIHNEQGRVIGVAMRNTGGSASMIPLDHVDHVLMPGRFGNLWDYYKQLERKANWSMDWEVREFGPEMVGKYEKPVPSGPYPNKVDFQVALQGVTPTDCTFYSNPLLPTRQRVEREYLNDPNKVGFSYGKFTFLGAWGHALSQARLNNIKILNLKVTMKVTRSDETTETRELIFNVPEEYLAALNIQNNCS